MGNKIIYTVEVSGTTKPVEYWNPYTNAYQDTNPLTGIPAGTYLGLKARLKGSNPSIIATYPNSITVQDAVQTVSGYSYGITGDSLSDEDSTRVPDRQPAWRTLMNLPTTYFNEGNLAVAGEDYPKQTVRYQSFVRDPSYALSIRAVYLGINDIGDNYPLSEMITRTTDFINLAISKGERVVLATLTAYDAAFHSNTTVEQANAVRLAYNQWLRDNYQSIDIWVLVDLASDYRIGPVGAGNNTTYFTDKLHMALAGRQIVADMFKQAFFLAVAGTKGVITGQSAPNTTAPTTAQALFVGDSQTTSYPDSNVLDSNSYPTFTQASLDPSIWKVGAALGQGYPNATTSSIQGNLPYFQGLKLGSVTKNYIVIRVGINNLRNGQSVDDAWGELVTFCTAFYNAGFIPIICTSTINRFGGIDTDAAQADYNNRIKSQQSTLHAVGVIALDTDYRLKSNSSVYQSDGVHETIAGRHVVADMVTQGLVLAVNGSTGFIVLGQSISSDTPASFDGVGVTWEDNDGGWDFTSNWQELNYEGYSGNHIMFLDKGKAGFATRKKPVKAGGLNFYTNQTASNSNELACVVEARLYTIAGTAPWISLGTITTEPSGSRIATLPTSTEYYEIRVREGAVDKYTILDQIITVA
jgi:lysophospholipase L1-like esterase